MSLIKKPKMIPRKLAAAYSSTHRRRGRATPARRERNARIRESVGARQLESQHHKLRFLILEAEAEAATAVKRLKALAEAVAKADYFTDRAQIESFEGLYVADRVGRPERILALLHRLGRGTARPTPAEGPQPAPDGEPSPVRDRGFRDRQLEAGIAAEGPEREAVRKELLALLSDEIRACEVDRSLCVNKLLKITIISNVIHK
jgi:hypothetical protein